jgi:membrane-bound serine protease (ClpP class)
MSRRRINVAIGIALITLGIGLGSTPAGGQTSEPAILALRLEGVVDDFAADYLSEGVKDAEAEGRPAVVVEIDTPGGLGSSMNMGASTPIGLDGGDLSNKVRNDASAQARSLAEHYGRDPDTAASFVEDAASLTAEEALQADVIDLIASSREELLSTLDGETVMLGTGDDVTLATAGVPVEERSIGGFVGFLHGLLDPSLAFLFFWLGLILLVLELLVPGHIFSGTIGTILLLLSLWSFGLLPVRWIGVALLLVSVACFVVELKAPGLGIWGAAGVVTLLLGGWFLYDRTGGVSVSPWVLILTAVLAAGFFGLVVAKVLRMRFMPVTQGPDAIVGKEGVVLARGVDQRGGLVRVAAEEWQAVSPTGLIPDGTPIRVTRLDGLVLTVEPVRSEHDGAGATAPATEGG